MIRQYKMVWIFLSIMLILLQPVSAQEGLSLRVEFPYSLQQGQKTADTGPVVKALLVAENTAEQSQDVNIRFSLPAGFTPVQLPAGWRDVGNAIEGNVNLAGGYGQWFELFSFDCTQAATGEHSAVLTYSAAGERHDLPISFSLGQSVPRAKQDLAIRSVTFPVDRYGKIDHRLNPNTLVLRDSTLDYVKNVLKGKGAYNDAAEAAHPLTYVRLGFTNPAREEKLLVVTFSLLDSSGTLIPGLTTPASTVEDRESGGFSGHRDETVAFIALDGSYEQIVDLPVYTADQVVSEGSFMLQISAREGDAAPLIYQTPVRFLSNNSKTVTIVLVGVLITAAGLLMLCRRWRTLLAGMKTRWLITIALFGSTSFVAVNVPATLLGDVLHLLLGPLSFLVTGMFNGVLLYMLIASLSVLIPVPGTIALLFAGRLLLNVLVFGHTSPTLFLFYGTQATLLETFIYLSRTSAANKVVGKIPKAGLLLLPLACAVADSVSSFINLHTLAFLYRLFYADWYIALTVLVNGFFYTAIGAGCGILLGKQLRRVGCE